MSNPLIYIDQNIIGLHLDGLLNLKKNDGLVWVYSKEHFSEIRRSSSPQQYLKVLNDIDAKLLDLEIDENWKITGGAKLIDHGTPMQHYEDYIDATGGVEFDDSVFDPFQVWVNGGGDEGPLRLVSDGLAEQVISLTSVLPFNTTDMVNEVNSIKPQFDAMVEEMISHGNDIKKTREAFGDGKGAIGGITGERQIEQIWEIISPAMNAEEISCDQFFGFDPIDKQGYESWPVYLGIVGCCAVMDILGFQAEKKCRKISKVHNVRSDSGHIAMGAFCSSIMSEDKRLVKRAKAIYEYKGIGTTALLVERKANKSMQPTANASAD